MQASHGPSVPVPASHRVPPHPITSLHPIAALLLSKNQPRRDRAACSTCDRYRLLRLNLPWCAGALVVTR